MKAAVRKGKTVRALASRDLGAVVAIDAALGGRARQAYFERRLHAAQRDPAQHLQFAVEEDGALAGFILGHALEGEFGRSEPALRLEALGVKASAQGRGLGAALAQAFEAAARQRGLGEIRTAALWREHELLRFLDRAGYRLAPVHVMDRALAGDYEPQARDEIEVGVFSSEDLEGAARVDRRHTGRDRRGYLCRSLAETLGDSALRVSLTARVDGGVAGFLMARLDYGDFGRVEPMAVIDTVGVDPLRARQGIGRALLSQLFANLGALGVERVETVVAPGNLELMGFFYRAGFRPAERLSFLKPLS
jgi:ribosomal protein S18 acetylase RimI-like enzyme